HTVAGAKDDRRDAFVLADSLRTDRPSFRQVHVEEPHLLMLRELSRTEEALLTEFRRATNQLREQLHRFYAPLLQLCPAADEPWLWELLELAPTPTHAACLTEAHVAPQHREELWGLPHLLAQLLRPGVDLFYSRGCRTPSDHERRPQGDLQVKLLLGPRRGLGERRQHLQPCGEMGDRFLIGTAPQGILPGVLEIVGGAPGIASAHEMHRQLGS